ncbi:MAG: hypothetical protein HOO99_01245 [Hyphomicrobiaceae bacterium]|nr:hypothetical protein [Hyphomicrobiaceae bacterium]
MTRLVLRRLQFPSGPSCRLASSAAQTQHVFAPTPAWIPAFAGMTECGMPWMAGGFAMVCIAPAMTVVVLL